MVLGKIVALRHEILIFVEVALFPTGIQESATPSGLCRHVMLPSNVPANTAGPAILVDRFSIFH